LASPDERKMRVGPLALMAVSGDLRTVSVMRMIRGRRASMRRRFVVVSVLAAALVLSAATFAVAGGSGLIWDDGHYAKPGTLDDGKDLLPQTKITVAQAVAAAKRAQSGQVGQVDLEHFQGRIVYIVDVGDQEVSVDATDGSIAATTPQD
jgi:uncharacterized membrane protein YkoI